MVYDRDPLQQTVKQTVIPGISKPPAQDAAKNAQVDPIKNTSFTVQVNEQSLGPFRAVERVISAKSSDARARSLADARSSSRNARGTTYWVQGSAQLLPGQVNTIRLDKDREVAFYYSDTLADIRGSLGHAMESHLKQQYKFKGLGSGKELRTFLAVNDKTSDSVTLTVNGDNQLVDLGKT